MIVLECIHHTPDGSISQYVTVPAKHANSNMQAIANIIMCDYGAVGTIKVEYYYLYRPSKSQIAEGKENWNQTFDCE